MAYNNDQNESALPTPEGNNKRTAADFLPKFFRTEANKKFLQGTIDQLIQPGVAEKINGYYGRKIAKAFTPSDNYISDVSGARSNYQLEPATVIKDNYDNVTFYKDYNDYMGQLGVFGANTDNHSRLNSQETYAWNPNIDWDKFVNFREYYWLPNGPTSVIVRGQGREIESTYSVSLSDEVDNIAYVFNNNLEKNPTLKLYRGQTYRFDINAVGDPMAFAISRSFTPGADVIDPNVSTLYNDGITKFDVDGNIITDTYIDVGTIEFTIPVNAPDRLFYISKNDIDTSGSIRVYDVEENTFLDVDADILGKKYYTSSNGVELSNGMKIRFQGEITPAQFNSNNWYVEGVGTAIKLIKDQDLVIPAAYSTNQLVPYDSENFDSLPFANASAYAADKDYIVVNRASTDRNAWSRYNCWHHKSVILKSAEYNELPETIDESSRAKRPIIEFEAGLKLNNSGSFAKQDVDLVDTFTTDVFSTIEGQIGYNIDGIDLADDMRILFTADTDVLVSGKIYQVKFITINSTTRQISLIETTDTNPQELETVLVTQGVKNAGKSYYYQNGVWKIAQEKTQRNQAPLFDVFDLNGNSFSDTAYYASSTFKGSKLFSYKIGNGATDTELDFALSYRSLENSGDITFSFDLLNDTFEYQDETDLYVQDISTGYLKKFTSLTNFNYVNGFSSTPTKSVQKAIRQYVATDVQLNNFEIDVYNQAGNLNDLTVSIFVNNTFKLSQQEYEIDRINSKAFVRFYNDLSINDVVEIKTTSATAINSNGHYEFPFNLERNPLNQDVSEFTLGEVIDHVDSMVEDITGFTGVYPGISNLRDLGDLDKYGKRFVKHSGPINLPLYHITNKSYNIVKALRSAKSEYSRFKRVFLETAASLGYDGPVKQHVDKILQELNKDKIKSQPFYFSDMLAYGPNNRIEYTVLDSRITSYAITSRFSLAALSATSVDVYLNGSQLVHEKDYTFDGTGFVIIDAGQVEGDIIECYEYTSTDGSFIAPTPTKLGLFPKYYPELTIDDTYQTEEPVTEGPYKVYGDRNGVRGWFYPVYTTKTAAQTDDVDSASVTVQFAGLARILYMPQTGSSYGAQDNVEITAYPVGVPFVRGHDGSYVRAYLDYRDELLLDLEKRIFNNIKAEYSVDRLDVNEFLGGDFRTGEFTKTEIDNSLLSDFTQWLRLIDNDYTDNYFYNRLNEFTFNYSNMNSPAGNALPGFWRGIYARMLDTDRPHTNPWEMLGISNKPSWWNEVYGPAPYTSNNLILWRDLEEGKISDPSNVRINSKYARPGLTGFIPVDTQGRLRSPLASSYTRNFILRYTTQTFKFGDYAPVETAWRRSSEYPFAVLTAFLLNKPAKVMGLGFDISRINRDLAGQWVYSETNKPLTIADLKLPNTYESNTRTNTAGLVNYIYNLVASDVLTVYDDYKNDLKGISNQLGIKIAGFTDKNKFNLILDSRTPTQQEARDGVFVPQENYQVFLNTSSPSELAVYSGVAIEKTANGYVVRGYNKEKPYFEYYLPRSGSTNITVTVGGISENTTEWAAETRYVTDQVIDYNGKFYRVNTSFTSGSTFDTTNISILATLPIVGGKVAEFKRTFNSVVNRMPYGTKLTTSQEVVDFLLGYNETLLDIGFDFQSVTVDNTVDNWDHAAREFLFWTTQGWASGTVITLSPGANRLDFKRAYNVVDDLNDPFYGYSVLKADGQPLPTEFGSLLRDQNSFGLQTVNTDEGLYHIALPLVQKEHVVLLDNTTAFNDVIYQPATGYRQERIKVNGYRSDNWNGGLNIPGFVYDDARYDDWNQWKDYKIGSLVKYKQYYYVAIENIVGTEDFVSSSWYRLSDKPESELITNFDYRINQFADFYDLDSDGFDTEQQKMAQHLIGYQKRQYLANIINDDVSQFKFYRGFIADKGTMNALTKLFDALGSADTDNLDFYEEWAIQVGRFGAVDDIQQVEYNIKQDKLQESPQAVELLSKLPATNFDKIYRILPYEVYDKPADYNHAPFPTINVDKEYIKTGGYVNEEDITYIAGTINELALADVNQISLGEYIWIVSDATGNWTVQQLVRTTVNILSSTKLLNRFADNGAALVELTTDKWTTSLFETGDIIGVVGAETYNLTGLYEVDNTNLEKIQIRIPTTATVLDFTDKLFVVIKLRTVRINSDADINNAIQQDIYDQQRIWVDNYNGTWTVLENNKVYENRQTITNVSTYDSTAQEFSKSITASSDNNNLFVSAPGDGDGKVSYYRRTKETFNLQLDQEIILNDSDLFDYANSKFGESIDVSPDGEFLAVGIPNASGVKTRLAYNEAGTFDFDPNKTYTKNEILRYRESLWKANREILPQIASQPFSTFDSYINLASLAEVDSTTLNLIVAGDPGLAGNTVDHLLVRAPKDMYLGTKAGDTINLFWNSVSYAYPTLDEYLPFGGAISEISEDVLSQEFVIDEKIDHIFFIETFVTLPAAGDIVTTDTGSAEVVYVSTSTRSDSAVIYLKNTNGIFEIYGELFISDEGFVGFYTEEATYDISDAVAGFWLIKTKDPVTSIPFSYSNNGTYYDTGRGLTYSDIRLQSSIRNINEYYNIQKTISRIGTYVLNKNRASYITQLSYRGDPAGQDGIDGVEAPQPDNRWVVRVGKVFSDTLTTGDSYEFRLYDLDNRIIDVGAAGFSYNQLNKFQTISDIWSGYIDIEFTRFDFGGFAFEPQIGDIIEDVQFPRDGAGGLALTSVTTSSAEIVMIQRQFNNIRVYVNVLTGTWDQQNNIGRYDIRRKASVSIRGVGDVDRVIGTVNDASNDIVVGTSLVGKLLVFEADFNFDIVTNPEIVDEEYWFFNEITESGIARLANPPFSLNKDYTQVYNIPADEFGTAGDNDEGAVAIYRRSKSGDYRLQNVFVSEYRTANRHFGSKIKLVQTGNYYTLLVGTDPDTSSRNDPGSIEIFRHGTKPTDSFKGEYKLTGYSKDDIVIYRDDYYIARKNIDVGANVILDNIYWNKISWQYGKDKDYRGEFNNSYRYAENTVVVYNNQLWRATTNISVGAAVPSDANTEWTTLSSNIDYLGYLPNLTASAFYDEEVFDPAENIEQFSRSFDISDDAQVLVVTSRQIDTDSVASTKIVIYRAIGDKFVFDQIITAPNNVDGFADAVSLNPAGTQFAVGAPLTDSNKINQGVVFVYTQVNGQFTLTQTLTPPNNEESENFGYRLDFGNSSLVISSLNGDQKIPTTFDLSSDNETTFDNNFTEFKNINLDKGVVYIYETVNNNLIYSEQFVYPLTQTTFGENLYVQDNHVYVGLPSQFNDLSRGTLVDFRKPKNTTAWSTVRQSVLPVDVSKIRGAFIYNKRTNSIVSYIDYIDPIQGKIAGSADQEITYKVGYDPATYNTGSTADFSVDARRGWTGTYVGQVWWNINTAKFAHPYQGTTTFQKNNWNKLLEGSSINVYEWVESNYLPSTWDNIADSDAGTAEGISGQSLYGDSRYSTKLTYDDASQTFRTTYYFWVTGKRTVPVMENRILSIEEIALLIENPRVQGYRFLSMLTDNKFVINNCENIITSDDLVLNIRYATGPKEVQNVHAQYHIMSDNLATSIPHPDIERKWFDSLIGFDTNSRAVPDNSVTIKNRYGIQNRPRQSMFVNRFEALKQLFERVNIVFYNTLLTDEYDISNLLQKEETPSLIRGEYDLSVDTVSELQYISTSKISPAILTPVITNGKIIRIDITQSGRGYKVAPSYVINGDGSNVEFEITINNLGQVTGVTLINGGTGYNNNTSISVRPFTVLVQADDTVFGKWSLYSWSNTQTQWYRRSVQDYDVSAYWSYTDWYATGYNQFTDIVYAISESYKLSALNDNIGDVVKIENIGSGGWLLLEKIANEDTEDYTINYNTIGRQNGTIQFNDSLYDYSKNTVGFDNRSFDSFFYDNHPAKELRIILETLRDKVFTADLAIEYNQLFFAGLRYVLAEQQSVDWMFKTSFVKAKHNLGKLYQDVTFNNNNLPSYQSYVEEVKPYSTKIREFISNYDALDNTQTSTTDFDLSPHYDKVAKSIQPSKATISKNVFFGLNSNTSVYPRKHWLENAGYKIKEILISKSGTGYTYAPVVKIIGGGGTGATATAYIGYGAITKIEVTNAGSGYTSAPSVVLEGSQDENGVVAVASAVLGNGLVRSSSIKIKFDRIAGTYFFQDLSEVETFTGTGAETRFFLEWPMDLDTRKVKVYVDEVEQLRSKYTYSNIANSDVSYDREQGKILFTASPALDAVIRVEYYKPLSMLSAEDRIQFAYNPLSGMFGKNLAQLMTGVDYGGVEVRSLDFAGTSGWDSQGWYTDTWDTYDNTFEDEIFIADGSTIFVEVSTPLETGVVYTIYKNGVRIDDPNYTAGTPTNVNAIVNSITGDGITTVIELDDLGIRMLDGDILVIRKITSDGSIIPDADSYDTALSGGDLAYSTAKGINAEEIIVDGDGFVTPTTSGGPEELVPGQVLDTLDIKVFTKESGGQGIVYSQSYIMNGSIDTYDLGVIPGSSASIFVKVDNILLADTEYSVNWSNNSIVINNPVDGVEFNIIAVAQGTSNIIDYGRLLGDESTTDYETTVDFVTGASAYASVNGVQENVVIYESETTGNTVIRFNNPILTGDIINYTIFNGNTQVNYSQITKDVYTADGILKVFELGIAPFYAIPTEHNIMIKVGNSILNPGYNIQFTIPENLQREYALEAFQQPQGSLTLEDVKVFLNGDEISAPIQWRFEIANSAVVLANEVGAAGDLLEIYVVTDGDYRVSGTTVTFDTAPANGEIVEVFQFSNHNIIGIERINYDVVARSTLILEDIEYVTYNRLTVGEIKLRSSAIDAQYVWVSVNGELLTPSVDYYVTNDRLKVQLVNTPAQNDVIDILHFSADVNVPKFAYRQFKDMLNRTHFKRLDSAVTTLAQPLNYYDLRIELVDGTNVSEPNKSQNLPGVIFIAGERIEYFVKQDNTLRQLRRGTLGTGVKEIHAQRSNVYDQNISKTVPYKDRTLAQNFIADGVSNTYAIDYPVKSVNEIEVFAAGVRLRKNSIEVFDPTVALDSPLGDITIPAEFTFDAETNTITIADVPVEESKIIVVKKVGQIWTPVGVALGDVENSIGRFLRAGTSALPE